MPEKCEKFSFYPQKQPRKWLKYSQEDLKLLTVAGLLHDIGKLRINDLYDVEDKLEYIITVDIFNEGVDIPEINQVLLVRPTQSSIIFIQQFLFSQFLCI